MCFICAVFILGVFSACSPESSDSSKIGFSAEKQALLKLNDVSEDQDGNFLIPLKINDEKKITLPNGNEIIYSLNSQFVDTQKKVKIMSVSKEYKYKYNDSFATAKIITDTECEWANESVSIARTYHDVLGNNPFGDIVISNKENTTVKDVGVSAIAESSGNIEFKFTENNNNSSELVAYRMQIILDADNAESVVVKVIN